MFFFFSFFLMYLVSGFFFGNKVCTDDQKSNKPCQLVFSVQSNFKNFSLYSLAILDLNYGKKWSLLQQNLVKLRLLYTFTGVSHPSDVVHPV